MMERLLECVAHCDRLLKEQGKEIGLALEPEPGCYLGTAEETSAFFKTLLRFARERRMDEDSVRRHLGVCVDTCHVAVQFEDLEETLLRYVRDGVRISKIQLSAAMEVEGAVAAEKLIPFNEPVYLHQAAALHRDGRAVPGAGRFSSAPGLRTVRYVPEGDWPAVRGPGSRHGACRKFRPAAEGVGGEDGLIMPAMPVVSSRRA